MIALNFWIFLLLLVFAVFGLLTAITIAFIMWYTKSKNTTITFGYVEDEDEEEDRLIES